jgi:hypothetical protein
VRDVPGADPGGVPDGQAEEAGRLGGNLPGAEPPRAEPHGAEPPGAEPPGAEPPGAEPPRAEPPAAKAPSSGPGPSEPPYRPEDVPEGPVDVLAYAIGAVGLIALGYFFQRGVLTWTRGPAVVIAIILISHWLGTRLLAPRLKARGHPGATPTAGKAPTPRGGPR